RFSAQLSFSIESETLSALKEKSDSIINISAERIHEELNKILLSDNVFSAFLTLRETNILKNILPEFDRCFDTEQNIKYHLYNVGVHSLYVVKNCSKRLYLKYAALLHDIGKPDCRKTDEFGIDTFRNHAKLSTELSESILKRLKFDNKSTDKILRLIKFHDREIVVSKKAIKRAVIDVGEDIFEDLIDLKKAEVYAQNTNLTLPRLKTYNDILDIYKEIQSNNEAMSLKDLDINGNDIMKLGFEGKEIGIILHKVLLHIINTPEDNQKEEILKIIKKNKNLWLKEK
ncbi:MAG: HD domain-containing protein, partial [Clostridia bacterium]|nr:HD domain-containing protein [Clostridia bacterium]